MSRTVAFVAAVFLGILGLAQPSSAQQDRVSAGAAQNEARGQRTVVESEASLSERMNANTVTVISGTPGGTYFRAASDMAFVLDDNDNLRILPVLGERGGAERV